MEHSASATAAFSRAEAIEDLDALARLIDRVHPAPYRFQSRDIVDAERKRLAGTMPESITRIELCLRLSRLLAAMDDGHRHVLREPHSPGVAEGREGVAARDAVCPDVFAGDAPG